MFIALGLARSQGDRSLIKYLYRLDTRPFMGVLHGPVEEILIAIISLRRTSLDL